MPLQIPTEESEVRTLIASVESELPELDISTKRRAFHRGLVVALAKSIHHFYLALQRHANFDIWPQTATGDFLFRGWWSDLTGVKRKASTGSHGAVVLIGVSGTIIPQGTRLLSTGVIFEVENTVTIQQISGGSNSLQVVNGVVVMETIVPHGLATGVEVTIAGSSVAEYNGTFSIIVTSGSEFTYLPDILPLTISAGSPTFSTTLAKATVMALTNGDETNVDGGGSLLLETAITDVDAKAIVSFDGLINGTSLELEEAFRERIMEALASTLGTFTADEIRTVVKEVPGVTRVWIRKAMNTPDVGWPSEGRVRIAFMRDNDANPFPSSQEVQEVKQKIIDTIMPAHMDEENLLLFSPTKKVIDIPISGLEPNTESMRLAVEASLKQLFTENVKFGADLPKEIVSDIKVRDLNCAINSAVDLERNENIQAFVLGITVDIPILPDELPILGQISWA